MVWVVQSVNLPSMVFLFKYKHVAVLSLEEAQYFLLKKLDSGTSIFKNPRGEKFMLKEFRIYHKLPFKLLV